MLILQKIYFLTVFSYIIYFIFIISNYKYKIILPKYKAFTIIIIAVIISIFGLLYIFNHSSPVVWSAGIWTNNVDNYIGGKKKDLIIQEALHKTYKWKEYLNSIVKRLNEERELTYKEAKEFIGFLYGSNTIKIDDGKWGNIRQILSLDSGTNIPETPLKENIDNDKKNLLKKLINSSLKDKESDDLKFFSIPTKATEERLKYFIEGIMPEFDKMFSIFGGQGIYKADISGSLNPKLYGENDRGADENSINNGGKLKEPFTNSVKSIKTWLPVRYEFYDADFPNAVIIPPTPPPGNIRKGYKYFYVKNIVDVTRDGKNPDVVISDIVAGETTGIPRDNRKYNKRTLPSLIQNNFKTNPQGKEHLYEDGTGFKTYPKWLKGLDLIKILERRDLAKNINKPNKPNELIYTTTKNKFKMFGLDPPVSVPNIYEDDDDTGMFGLGAAVQGSIYDGGSNMRQRPYDVDKVENSENMYGGLYDTIKDDIDIDLLEGDVGEVNNRLKQKYSQTNYEQQNSETDKQKDYLKYFLNFSVYFGNLNFVIILSTLLLYLGSYKNKIINDNSDISENDKNLFNEKISKHIKYSKIFLLIFVLIFLFSFKEFKKYTDFLIKLSEWVNNIKYFIIGTLALVVITYFMISGVFNKTNAQEKIANLFISDLNRNSKLTKPSDRIDPSITSNTWICYSKTNQCTNRKDYVVSNPKNTTFKSEQECKNSGCESKDIKNSGISAYKYNKINT